MGCLFPSAAVVGKARASPDDDGRVDLTPSEDDDGADEENYDEEY